MSDLDTLRPLEDTTLTQVRRIFYVFKGEVDRHEGEVELTFSSGQVVLGQAGPEGYSMRLGYEPWVDPFEGHMTPENQEYVATHGKAEAFDVSDEAPFNDRIGKKVTDIFEIAGISGWCIGYVFYIGGEMLVMWANCDETFATVLPKRREGALHASKSGAVRDARGLRRCPDRLRCTW